MRPRTPTLVWIPFVFSIGTISWALLIAGLAMVCTVIVAPALRDVKEAEAARNQYQATLEFHDQQIALQKEFIAEATTDPVLMQRLAGRQLNLLRKDQQLLILDPDAPYKDHSVESLLAESLNDVAPRKVEPMPQPIAMALQPAMRSILIIAGCAAMALSFFLGVKYERA